MSAYAFNQDLSKWDVSAVTNMDHMFWSASGFYHVLCGVTWVESNATKEDMFKHSPGSISVTACTIVIPDQGGG